LNQDKLINSLISAVISDHFSHDEPPVQKNIKIETMNVVTITCWSVLLAIASRYAIWYVSTFRKALRIEGSTPLPSVRIYTPRYSPLVYVISPYIAPLFKYLPFGWGNWMRYAVRDGTWQHKGTLPRKELGSDVYWLLGPGGPQLWVADADLISDITHRWKDFPKPVMYYTQLLLFGENVLTAEGPLWQFHRKITVRSFNPKNNRFDASLFEIFSSSSDT
jgi:hypothetical protein